MKLLAGAELFQRYKEMRAASGPHRDVFSTPHIWGGCVLPFGTLPAGHGAPVEFWPPAVCEGLGDDPGTPAGVAVFSGLGVLALLVFGLFPPALAVVPVVPFVAAPFAVDDAGTHGAALGVFVVP